MAIEEGKLTLSLKHKVRLGEDPSQPLVYLIHGRAGNFDVMWTFANLFPKEWNVIAPQADLADPVLPLFPNGLSWWSNESELKIYERAAIASAKLGNFIREAEHEYKLTPVKRIAFGFSQGAALLSYLMQQQPELFVGVALLAGFVIRADSQSSQSLPKVFMAHGTKDEVINVELSKEGLEYLKKVGYEVNYQVEDIGHKVGSATIRELKNWITTQFGY